MFLQAFASQHHVGSVCHSTSREGKPFNLQPSSQASSNLCTPQAWSIRCTSSRNTRNAMNKMRISVMYALLRRCLAGWHRCTTQKPKHSPISSSSPVLHPVMTSFSSFSFSSSPQPLSQHLSCPHVSQRHHSARTCQPLPHLSPVLVYRRPLHHHRT
jgi:hypothetical protein